MWHATLAKSLIDIGFTAISSDTRLFVKGLGSSTCFVIIYFDDAFITGASSIVIQDVKEQLEKRFKITELGKVLRVLRMETTT